MTSVRRSGAPGNGPVTTTCRGIGSSGRGTPAVSASCPAHRPAALTTTRAAASSPEGRTPTPRPPAARQVLPPGLLVPDHEEVAVLVHVERDPVLLGEAQDHPDALDGEEDVDGTRELVAEAAGALPGRSRPQHGGSLQQQDRAGSPR